MNQNVKFVLFLGLIMALLSGCKYEEGPFLSFQSREERIAGIWKVAYATDEAGEENTTAFEDLTFIFGEDFSAEAELETSIGTVEFNGTWDLSQDDTVFQLEDLELPLGIASFDEDFDILRLTEDEFWLRDQQDSLSVIQLEAIL
ncbi:MAG: hypothetical protein AAF804_13645 [Bacteroidota bacterium]